jgi:hypothetical protein
MEMEIEIGVRNLMVEGRNVTVRSRSRDIWFVYAKACYSTFPCSSSTYMPRLNLYHS